MMSIFKLLCKPTNIGYNKRKTQKGLVMRETQNLLHHFYSWVDQIILDLSSMVVRIRRSMQGDSMQQKPFDVARLGRIEIILHEMIQQAMAWKGHPDAVRALWTKAPQAMTQEMHLFDRTVYSLQKSFISSIDS